MNADKTQDSIQPDDLRQQDEGQAKTDKTTSPNPLSPEEAITVLHELLVHQIELKQQNEELRQTQVKLDAARARYFELYNLAPVGYCTLSERGLILEVNLTAATLLGVTPQALLKKPLTRFILPEDQDIYYLHRKQLLTRSMPQALDIRMLRADGASFWGNLQIIPAQKDGECWITLNDITERKQAEESLRLNETKKQQIRKAESLARMAGAIAHHFNNLLGVVMGNVELAVDALPRGLEPVDNLTDALRAARKAAKVSSLMLTYLGQTSGEREPLDLAEVCGSSLPMLQAALPENVTLETDIPSSGPLILTNENQIQQVLVNVVTNAWEAIGSGRGVIRLAVKTVSPADIPVAHCFPPDWQPQDNPYACLEVSDTGCGIAVKNIEEIFDPFFSDKFIGRGLGLSVVQGIVQAHNGAITVVSQEGQGSVFLVFLPVCAEEVPMRPDQVDKAREKEWCGMMLLVEDDKMLREMAAEMLKLLGFTVLSAKDGVEALEVFMQHKDEIRCVLSDVTMPRMNGWETLAALRKIAPTIPVVLASGYTEVLAMAGDHPERPQAFLSKPYLKKELVEAISHALGEQ